MILKRLDSFRRKIMPKITGNIGKKNSYKKINKIQISNINRVLICRPNQRLGNILLTTPLIQEIENIFPDCKIDIIVKGTVAEAILKEYDSIDKIIVLPRKPFKEITNYLKIFFSVKFKKYDLVINGVNSSSSGRILTYLANSKFKIFGFPEDELSKMFIDYKHIAKSAIYNLRYDLFKVGFYKTIDSKQLPNLNLKLTKEELLNGRDTLEAIITDKHKETIVIFTYATGAKCYSKEWWYDFYAKLDKKYGSSYNIIEILPVENTSQIDFKATTFYSKDIREIASLIANTSIFIGADSGIMHLASSAITTTIGLFSITREDTYKPYGNNSISFDTNTNTIEDLLNTIHKLLKL